MYCIKESPSSFNKKWTSWNLKEEENEENKAVNMIVNEDAYARRGRPRSEVNPITT